MTIKAGDPIPSVKLKILGEKGMEEIDIAERFKDKKVVMFGVPGAFTPTCNQKHLPSFVEKAEAFRSRGFNEVICVAVNDPFVMKHWGIVSGAKDRVTMLPDGNGDLTKAMGLELDLNIAGLGMRSQRYVMVVNKGVVESIEVEPNPGELTVAAAGACLSKLGS